MSKLAHDVKQKKRTGDIVISENIDFSGLLLSDRVTKGLKNSGFVRPSPIQLKAIPLGRCGLDLIVQAKSGTGKTCVFSVIALDNIQTDSSSTQVLVLAPTREIAVQIWEVICGIGSATPGLKCHTFIGGLPLHEDRVKLKKCHIAVGSPGRIKQLIQCEALKTKSIRLFVLDEADKLLEESFQEQINWIYSSLPDNKQMLALSATYPEYLADHLTAYMRNPTFLRLNISDPALLGIRQYYQTVPTHPMSHVVFEEKSKILTTILSSVSFQQCLVFSNLQTRAQNLADSLSSKGWPTACIAGRLDQKDRNAAMAQLKTYKCRILISTDLTSRGIDADKVNLVINMDIPKDHETYLHRIGRAGRYGSFGVAVTLVSDGQERLDLNSVEKRCNTQIYPLPDPIPSDLARPGSPIFLNDVVSTEVINTDKGSVSTLTTLENGVLDTSLPETSPKDQHSVSVNSSIEEKDQSNNSTTSSTSVEPAVCNGIHSPLPGCESGSAAVDIPLDPPSNDFLPHTIDISKVKEPGLRNIDLKKSTRQSEVESSGSPQQEVIESVSVCSIEAKERNVNCSYDTSKSEIKPVPLKTKSLKQNAVKHSYQRNSYIRGHDESVRVKELSSSQRDLEEIRDFTCTSGPPTSCLQASDTVSPVVEKVSLSDLFAQTGLQREAVGGSHTYENVKESMRHFLLKKQETNRADSETASKVSVCHIPNQCGTAAEKLLNAVHCLENQRMCALNRSDISVNYRKSQETKCMVDASVQCNIQHDQTMIQGLVDTRPGKVSENLDAPAKPFENKVYNDQKGSLFDSKEEVEVETRKPALTTVMNTEVKSTARPGPRKGRKFAPFSVGHMMELFKQDDSSCDSLSLSSDPPPIIHIPNSSVPSFGTDIHQPEQSYTKAVDTVVSGQTETSEAVYLEKTFRELTMAAEEVKDESNIVKTGQQYVVRKDSGSTVDPLSGHSSTTTASDDDVDSDSDDSLSSLTSSETETDSQTEVDGADRYSAKGQHKRPSSYDQRYHHSNRTRHLMGHGSQEYLPRNHEQQSASGYISSGFDYVNRHGRDTQSRGSESYTGSRTSAWPSPYTESWNTAMNGQYLMPQYPGNHLWHLGNQGHMYPSNTQWPFYPNCYPHYADYYAQAAWHAAKQKSEETRLQQMFKRQKDYISSMLSP